MRSGLSAEMFHAGPQLHVDRPTHAAIFNSLLEATTRSLANMNRCDQRRFASAWRRSAEQWLCGHA